MANGDPIWSTMLVEDPHQDGANRPPPVGQHYVVAHVAMTNYGEQTVAYSARRFTLEGVDDHRRYDALDVFGKCSHRSSRGAR